MGREELFGHVTCRSNGTFILFLGPTSYVSYSLKNTKRESKMVGAYLNPKRLSLYHTIESSTVSYFVYLDFCFLWTSIKNHSQFVVRVSPSSTELLHLTRRKIVQSNAQVTTCSKWSIIRTRINTWRGCENRERQMEMREKVVRKVGSMTEKWNNWF